MTRGYRDWLGLRRAELSSAATCRFCRRTENVGFRFPALYQPRQANYSPLQYYAPQKPSICAVSGSNLCAGACPKWSKRSLESRFSPNLCALPFSTQVFGSSDFNGLAELRVSTFRLLRLGGRTSVRTLAQASLLRQFATFVMMVGKVAISIQVPFEVAAISGTAV
jgi:hypothetical protein